MRQWHSAQFPLPPCLKTPQHRTATPFPTSFPATFPIPQMLLGVARTPMASLESSSAAIPPQPPKASGNGRQRVPPPGRTSPQRASRMQQGFSSPPPRPSAFSQLPTSTAHQVLSLHAWWIPPPRGSATEAASTSPPTAAPPATQEPPSPSARPSARSTTHRYAPVPHRHRSPFSRIPPIPLRPHWACPPSPTAAAAKTKPVKSSQPPSLAFRPSSTFSKLMASLRSV